MQGLPSINIVLIKRFNKSVFLWCLTSVARVSTSTVPMCRYQVSITITVFFFIHVYVEIGGMVNVPLSSPPLPLRDGPHITGEPPLTVTSPQLDCDQSLSFFRFSEGKTRARVENAFSHRRDHFPVSRVSLDRLRKKERDCSKPTPQLPPLCNGHFFCPCGQKIHTMTLV